MLSFVIPVYNPNIEIFKKCLKSIKEQSLKDWEAIVVFDGEDKEAEVVMEQVGGRKFQKIVVPHGGVQKARNAGARLVKGDILCFWDGDCVIEPCAAKTWIDTFKDNPHIDFVYSGYKFLGEKGGIVSEPFDPWLLKCGNYISTCFPMRKSVFPGFDETLESLQDWDMWLTIVERGGKGMFIEGFAFSTAYPTPESISGKNCLDSVWLDRVKAVKIKHDLPNRKVCVSSLGYKEEGIRLAKAIEADYKDVPNYKPNEYDTLIQVGFSLHPKKAGSHSAIFNQKAKKKIIFWTMADVVEANNFISLKALKLYAERLNPQCHMFVEDMAAKRIMESAGFKVKVLPCPMVNKGEIEALPPKPTILVDITPEYGQVFTALQYSLPEMAWDTIDTNKEIKDFSAILALNPEKTMTFNVKRMLLAGRGVVSNIQAPFCGFVNDEQDPGKYISELVEMIRKVLKEDTKDSVGYWNNALAINELVEVLNK